MNEKLDKQKVIDWVKNRTTYFYRGANVLTEFEEFLWKINSGDFDAMECKHQKAKERMKKEVAKKK